MPSLKDDRRSVRDSQSKMSELQKSEMTSSEKPPRLLDQVRGKIRLLHYSIRTEEAYVGWIRRFILFHNKRHPKEMREPEIEQFLTSLAVEGHVAASTQNQAMAALLFLYQVVLEIQLQQLNSVRAKRPDRLPVVLSIDEVRLVLGGIGGVHRVMADLLYGAGLRLLEVCRLRVKDLDFARGQILVRGGWLGQNAPEPVRTQPRANLLEQRRKSTKTQGVAQLDTRDWGILPQTPVRKLL